MAIHSASAITRSVSRCIEPGLLLGASLFSATAGAQGLPPWSSAKSAPVDETARSVHVRARDEPLFTHPTTSSARRGAAANGARLPYYGRARGAGCAGEWLLVGPTAWICGDRAELSSDPPLDAPAGAATTPDGLPRNYYFVGTDGAFGYDDLRTAEETKPVSSLEPGFSVASVQLARKSSGDSFALTTKGIWIPLRDLHAARPLLFRGYDVEAGKLDKGWVVVDGAHRFEKPNGRRLAGDSPQRFDTIAVLEIETVRQHTWVRTDGEAWLDGSDVTFPRPAEVPAEARPGERWIDVDLASQVLTAYEGDRPVFATLVSTGKGRGEQPTATPTGTSRVWVKLRTTDMTNLEDEDASRYYAIEDVPWVMFFHNGVGLHGAFWHRSFGHVRSHGCVNMTPLDAEKLFQWAGPHLPVGWTAALPTDYDPGTLVRVR
jgi:hypothetical protein